MSRSALHTVWRFRAAVIVAALQSVPVDIPPSAEGRFIIALGAGADRYEQERLDCSGAPIARRTVSSRTVSATASAQVSRSMHFDGFVGETTTDAPLCQTTPCDLSPAFKGTFTGIRLRVESEGGALGFGFASTPVVTYNDTTGDPRGERRIEPTLAIRLGSAAPGRTHLRVTSNDVPSPGSLPMTTIGLGFSSDSANPVRGFFGFAIPPYSGDDNGSLLVRAELMIPAGRHAQFAFGFASNTNLFTGSAGLRWRWGAATAAP